MTCRWSCNVPADRECVPAAGAGDISTVSTADPVPIVGLGLTFLRQLGATTVSRLWLVDCCTVSKLAVFEHEFALPDAVQHTSTSAGTASARDTRRSPATNPPTEAAHSSGGQHSRQRRGKYRWSGWSRDDNRQRTRNCQIINNKTCQNIQWWLRNTRMASQWKERETQN